MLEKECKMTTGNAESSSKQSEIVLLLRMRAKSARRNANIALLFIFLFIFSGISLFYFAGDIVISQSEPVQQLYLK
jgi:hypothetical protein